MNLVLLLQESEVKATQPILGQGRGPEQAKCCTPGQAALQSLVSTETRWKMGKKDVLLIPSAKVSHRNLLSVQSQSAVLTALGTDLLSQVPV